MTRAAWESPPDSAFSGPALIARNVGRGGPYWMPIGGPDRTPIDMNAFENLSALSIKSHHLGDNVLRTAQSGFIGLVGVFHRQIETRLINARHIDRQ